MRFVSKAKATLHSPSAALNRSSLTDMRVAGAIQRIQAGPPELRPELLEKASQRQNFRPHVLAQFVELRLKLVADLNNPAQVYNMIYRPYDVKYIYRSGR